MGNLVLSTPEWHGFRPYVGGGLGGVVGMVYFARPLGAIHDTDFTFSYQAFAGLNYKLSRHIDLGIGYKFLQTGDHNWAENGVTLKTEGSGTHSITASFTWNFSGKPCVCH
jgi:opacity protein-like surface antigen